MAICTVWLCWAVLAPIVAERAWIEQPRQHVCPLLVIKHGVGSDLKTYTKVRDLCRR